MATFLHFCLSPEPDFKHWWWGVENLSCENLREFLLGEMLDILPQTSPLTPALPRKSEVSGALTCPYKILSLPIWWGTYHHHQLAGRGIMTTHVEQPLWWPSRSLVQLTHFCGNVLPCCQTSETAFETCDHSDCFAGRPFSYCSDDTSLLVLLHGWDVISEEWTFWLGLI